MKRYIPRSVNLLYPFTRLRIPTLPCRYPTLVLSGLSFHFFFCNDKQICVCLLIFSFLFFFFTTNSMPRVLFYSESFILTTCWGSPSLSTHKIFNLTLFFTLLCVGNTAYSTNLQYFPIIYDVAVNNLVLLYFLLLKVYF